ncbi:MAG: hypothetical protein LLG04_17740 [Parachlamydia sp.]|nr:hypothetical protein [Parachlamydia sp.]
MKQSFICSMILMLTIATGLPGAQDLKNKHLTNRRGMTQIKCKAVPLDPELARTRMIVRAQKTKKPTQTQNQVFSLNWAGYVAATSINHPQNLSVEVVSGAWIAPLLAPSQGDSYVSIFVGIDGFAEHSATVEQIGTFHQFIGGIQSDFVFIELFPHPPLELVGFPVSPGNVMGGEVAYIGHNTFAFYIMNFSLKIFTSVRFKVHNAKRNSAEWIVEAPTINNDIQPLADFDFVPFLECTAKIDKEVGAINDDDTKYAKVIMLSESFVPKAAPTKLKKDGTEFIVGWLSPGP